MQQDIQLYWQRLVTTNQISTVTRNNPFDRTVVNLSRPYSVARQGRDPRFPKLYTGAFSCKTSHSYTFSFLPGLFYTLLHICIQ